MAADETCHCGGCTGSSWKPCESCSNSCSKLCGTCSNNCGEGCWGACSSNCTGCSGKCSGCGGCDSGCKSTCKNQCTDSCNNGCKTSNMAQIYSQLSAGLELLIMKNDMSLIEDLIRNEYSRRAEFKNETLNFTDISVGENVTTKLPDEFYQALDKILGKPNPEKEQQNNLTDYERMQNYIVILKALYNKVIPQK